MVRPNLRIRSLEETESADSVAADADFWSFEDENDIWILVCSIGVGLTALFLLYRICKDCCIVEGGSRIKRSKLSERLENQEKAEWEPAKQARSRSTNKRKIGASDKENQKGGTPKAKKKKSKKSSSKTESTNRDTSDDSRTFVSSKSAGKRTPGTGSTVSVGSTSKREPRRHISASKSFDDGTKRRLRSSSPPSEKKTASSKSAGKRTPGTGSTVSVGSTSKREPRRHISASKSFDNGTKGRPSSSHISASKSFDNGTKRPPSSSRPPSEKKPASQQSSSRSKSSKKAEVKGFLGPGNSTSPKKPGRPQTPPRRPVANSKPHRVD
jgi:hypothetical protein